jgi:hypothetical protein
VQEIWCALEAKLDVSFFNSWGWVSTWLTCLPNNLNVELIVNIEDNEPTCCFFMGITNEKLNKFKKKRAFLNATGFEKYDDLVIEYNAVLCEKNDTNRHLMFAFKALNDIEEFRFSHSVNIHIDSSAPFIQRITNTPSYWVNLKEIDREKGYLSYLSKNKRNQIKRSLKEYKALGDVQVEFACDVSQAKQYFSALESLHQAEWIKRGKPGAFAEPFFKEFHNLLIDTRFELGEIQLVRIFTEEEDIGYLYNFIFNNEVLFYQCGFNYKESNKFRPGIVSHHLTIEACIKQNYSKYNFLAGTTQYKQSLSTHSDTLKTIILPRKTIKSRLENLLKQLTNNE